MLDGLPVDATTHGGFRGWAGTQLLSTESGMLEFGGYCVSKCEPPFHQAKPRRSFCLPWTNSENSKVLLVPSRMSCKRTACGLEFHWPTTMNGAPPYTFGVPSSLVPKGVVRASDVFPWLPA